MNLAGDRVSLRVAKSTGVITGIDQPKEAEKD